MKSNESNIESLRVDFIPRDDIPNSMRNICIHNVSCETEFAILPRILLRLTVFHFFLSFF